jgi:flagellar motor protein MotB
LRFDPRLWSFYLHRFQVQFSERTVKAYESMVDLEARGPCHQDGEGLWWSRCPEDMMSVTGMYVASVQGYCGGHGKILAKVIASVLSAFMIYVKSVGRQYDAIARAYYAMRQQAAKQTTPQQLLGGGGGGGGGGSDGRGGAAGGGGGGTTSLTGYNIRGGLAFLSSSSGSAAHAAVSGSVENNVPVWSGELSIQYLCAVVNDMERVINVHLTELTEAHERTISGEGQLSEGVLEVQDIFYAMGNRGASLLARLLVESLSLETQWAKLFSRDWSVGLVGGEVAHAAEELNASLLRVKDWLDETPFFPRVVAAASDFMCQAYLWRLVLALDPSVRKNAPAAAVSGGGGGVGGGGCGGSGGDGGGGGAASEDQKRRSDFWTAEHNDALSKDVSAISSALSKHWPAITARSLDEVRETQQLLNITLESPEDDEESFAMGVEVLVGLVRTHWRGLHARLVKFTELVLVAREDVDSDTTQQIISTMVLQLEAWHQKNPSSSNHHRAPPSTRPDLFTLLYDDDSQQQQQEQQQQQQQQQQQKQKEQQQQQQQQGGDEERVSEGELRTRLSSTDTGTSFSSSVPGGSIVPGGKSWSGSSKTPTFSLSSLFGGGSKQQQQQGGSVSRVRLVSDSTDRLSALSANEDNFPEGKVGNAFDSDDSDDSDEDKMERTTPPPIYSAPAAAAAAVPPGSSQFSKDVLKSVVKRYSASGSGLTLGAAKWTKSNTEVEDIVSGRSKGARAQYRLEVDLVEANATSALGGSGGGGAAVGESKYAPRCVLALGIDERTASDSKVEKKQGGTRVLWNEHFVFDKVYNVYGTDLDIALYKGRPPRSTVGAVAGVAASPFTLTSSSSSGSAVSGEQPVGRVVIPLASLDLEQPLDDWYLLSNGGGLRLRLTLRQQDT